MSSNTPFKDVRTDRIGGPSPIGGEPRPLATPTQSFQSFMEQSPSAGAAKGPALESPFELMQTQKPLAAGPTFDTLLGQVKAAHATLGDIQTQINTPNLKLNQGRKYLLKNKLSEANAHLRSANGKLGVDLPEEEEAAQGTGPFAKFIGLITDGQNQLQGAKAQLQQLKDKGETLSPGDLLLIQIKMNTAQQNLEFSSVILGNAVSDLKSLMQIQL